MNTLSPWDLSGLGMNFGLYRPRRASYTRATQFYRERSESYRYATKRGNSDSCEVADDDYIERAIRAPDKQHGSEEKTQVVYLKYENNKEFSTTANCVTGDPKMAKKDSPKQKHAKDFDVKQLELDDISVFSEKNDQTDNENDEKTRENASIKRTTMKNFSVLCVSFILVFSAFRAILNLQTSLYSEGSLGFISLSCVYITSMLAGFITPTIINKIHSKIAISIGMLCFIPWFAANLYPKNYTLFPTAFLAGLGLSIVSSAEVCYVVKLAFDTSVKPERRESDIVRFHGIFVACFQTHHMWGNLISSLVLSSKHHRSDFIEHTENNTEPILLIPPVCGVLYPCKDAPDITEFAQAKVESTVPSLWHAMLPYLVMGCVSCLLVIFCLDKIGAQVDPTKSEKQLIMTQSRYIVHHPTFRLLIPLLFFTGFQEGFIFADFNQAFVTCSLGVHYIGYCMITLGVANVIGAVLVAIFAGVIPREAILATSAIVHVALMVGYLLWIPNANLALFLGLAAAWGLCDAVWNTQCNSLICLTCSDDAHTAFANCRIIQNAGLGVAFVTGSLFCVSTKLYMLIILLVTAVLFYVITEYRIRHQDEVFSDDRTAQSSPVANRQYHIGVNDNY